MPNVHNIAEYLAPVNIANCDLRAYLTPQRCCNPIFAREVRILMTEKLQHVEAGLAFLCDKYLLKHPYALQ